MLDQTLSLPCGAVLPNRIAKAAMTEALSDIDGRPNLSHERLYRRFSDGGAGLIITGNVMIDGRYLERCGNVIVEEESVLPSLTSWAAAAKGAAATTVLVQLSHPGRQTQRYIAREPVAPSAVAAVQLMKGFGRPRALREEEIADLIARFAQAAVWSEMAGFAGVQIHGAHGYLVSQFLSPLTNQRTDGWGGSLAQRARFLVEIVRAVRARTKPGFILSVKLNSADFQRGGFAPEESLEVIGMLEREGIDLLEISGGNYESPEMFTGGDPRRKSTQKREAYFLAFAEQVRTVAKLPLMVTGGFRTRAAMQEALSSGAVDVIGLARPLALEPDLPRRLLDGSAEKSLAEAKQFFIRRLNMLADGAWSGRQLKRMGDGLAPDFGMGVMSSVIWYVVSDVMKARRRNRRLRGLRSTSALTATLTLTPTATSPSPSPSTFSSTPTITSTGNGERERNGNGNGNGLGVEGF